MCAHADNLEAAHDPNGLCLRTEQPQACNLKCGYPKAADALGLSHTCP